MILRPYQGRAVKNCLDALKKHGNTLLVSATGSGKTVMLSAVAGERLTGGGRVLVLQHRDELTGQNSRTFRQVCPDFPVSYYCADQKSWRGQATFGMVQTLCRDTALDSMPRLDLLVIDEAHHVTADSYQRIIERARALNPDLAVFGVTATPERSDRRGLAGTFDNVADAITITELVRAGHLVPPVGRVIDIGTQDQLRRVKRSAADYDMAEVEAIQNTTIHNRQIVDYWLEHSSDRPSVAFCSTVKHAEDMRDAFRVAGVAAEAVHGELGTKERRAILAAYDRGEIPMLCNPMILTEGWDAQICSAILLLRTSSQKSTMIQMAGRGLRKLDPRRYPGRVKRDCLILDFGISLLTHGDLNVDAVLGKAKDPAEKGEARKKSCPECKAELPVQVRECPLCGYEFKVELTEGGFYNELEELRLIEIDLLNNSPFRWISLFESDRVLVATGFDSWAAVCSMDGENWFSIGGQGREAQLLTIANRVGAVASADDFMRANETSRSAKKAAGWMGHPASQKQEQTLGRFGYAGGHYSKIEAAAHLTFNFNRQTIERVMGVAA
ncbi:DEAD/DEAH box helicase [Desulfuromonas thiophila]|uniref:DEAD/DEAH box helicase n=1 Tax=Desulfuromonas thiophila TaxID=57664 RepID=UPI0029F56C10|nr:DEAD/DEAH box helicase [Desulfuromonas thiophila]